MSDATPSQPVDELIITDDAHCVCCGYNLRMLRLDGRCPECGTPIDRSVRGILLRFGDPEWVARIARGAGFAYWGLIAAVVLGVAFVIAVSLFRYRRLDELDYVVLIFILVEVLMFGIGIGNLTAPAPNEVDWPQLRRVRSACRMIPLGLVAGGFSLAVFACGGLAGSLVGLRICMMSAMILTYGGIGLWAWCFFRFMFYMGERVPSNRTQRIASGGRLIAIVYIVLVATLVGLEVARTSTVMRKATGTAGALVSSTATSVVEMLSSLVNVLAVLFALLIVAFVWSLLRHACREFPQAAREAKGNWHSPARGSDT